MSYAFRILRDSGETIIDGNHVTLAHQHRAPITNILASSYFWGGGGANTGYYYQDQYYGGRFRELYPVPVTSQSPPLVALIPRAGACGHFQWFRSLGSPGNWTGFEIFYNRYMLDWDTLSPAFVKTIPELLPAWDYAVASLEGCPRSDDRWAMRLWDEEGRLVFDSGTPIMRIMEPLTDWERLSYNYGVARYTIPWAHGHGNDIGLIVSNLGCHSLESTNFTQIWAGPRVGFARADTNTLCMSSSGFSAQDRSLISSRAEYGAGMDNYLNQGGGFSSFAVKVPPR